MKHDLPSVNYEFDRIQIEELGRFFPPGMRNVNLRTEPKSNYTTSGDVKIGILLIEL